MIVVIPQIVSGADDAATDITKITGYFYLSKCSIPLGRFHDEIRVGLVDYIIYNHHLGGPGIQVTIQGY